MHALALSGAVGLCALACGTDADAGVVDRPGFSAKGLVIMWGASDFSENGGVAPVVVDFNQLDGVASGSAATDLIAADGSTINYNTGRFNASSDGSEAAWEYQINDAVFGGTFNSAGPHQTLDANDSYTAFGLDNDTDIDLLGGGARFSQFYVASNTAFDIYAEASDLVAEGAFSTLDFSNIRYRLRNRLTGGGGANRWGMAAQDPGVGGDGVLPPWTGPDRWTLDRIAGAPTKVFDGGRRTAAQPGNLMAQSVSFQSGYNLRGAGINGSNYDLSMGAGTLGATVTYTIYAP